MKIGWKITKIIGTILSIALLVIFGYLLGTFIGSKNVEEPNNAANVVNLVLCIYAFIFTVPIGIAWLILFVKFKFHECRVFTIMYIAALIVQITNIILCLTWV